MTLVELDALLHRAGSFRIVKALRNGVIFIVDNRLALFFYPKPGIGGEFEYDGLEVGYYQDEWMEAERQL